MPEATALHLIVNLTINLSAYHQLSYDAVADFTFHSFHPKLEG